MDGVRGGIGWWIDRWMDGVRGWVWYAPDPVYLYFLDRTSRAIS